MEESDIQSFQIYFWIFLALLLLACISQCRSSMLDNMIEFDPCQSLVDGELDDRKACVLKVKRQTRVNFLKTQLLDYIGIADPNFTIPEEEYRSKLAILFAIPSTNEVNRESDTAADEPLHPNLIPQGYIGGTSTRRLVSWVFQNQSAQANFQHDPKRSFFDLKKLHHMNDYNVMNASLFIFVKCPTILVQETKHNFDVVLYRYMGDAEINPDPYYSVKKSIDLRPNGTYVNFDLTELVKSWSNKPDTNFGLMVHAEYKGEDLVNRVDDPSDRTESMFIEIRVHQEKLEYIPERLVPVDCKHNDYTHKNCCRYPLEINFESFGWHWIVAPKRYLAYYCAGDCPLTHMPMDIRTTLLQTLQARDTQLDLGICCAPHHMTGMNMLYFNEQHEIIHRTVPNMIVQKCGCA